MKLAAYEAIAPRAELGEILARSVDHLVAMPKERLFRDFEADPGGWAYGGDFVGRWLDGMAHYHRMPQFRALDSGIMGVVDRLIEFQSANGFFGRNYTQSEYCGTLQIANALLETNQTFGHPAALASATRAIAFFMQNVSPSHGAKVRPKLNNTYVPPEAGRSRIRPDTLVPMNQGYRWFFSLDVFARYYDLSGERDALAYARAVFEQVDALKPCQEYGAITGNFHVLIHIYRGLLELWRRRGDGDILQKAVEFWEWIRDTKAHISGGVQEWLIAGEEMDRPEIEDRDDLFFSGEKEGRDKIDETCTVSDWMMLSFELYGATGEGRFLDMAEEIFCNHQLFDFASNGGWCGHRSFWGDAGCVWDFCCSHHGPRCLVDALRYCVTAEGERADVNLYVPLETQIDTQGGRAHLIVEPASDMGVAVIRCGDATEGRFKLRLRCPPWSEAIAVEGADRRSDGSLEVERLWRPGMRVQVEFKPRRGLEVRRGGPGITIGSAGNPVGALRSGPWVYALREERLGAFGLQSEAVAIGTTREEGVLRTVLELPAEADRLIAVHSNAALAPGSAGIAFRVYLGDDLAYDSGTYKALSFSNFVELPLNGARRVALEVRSPGGGVALELGRWRDVRIVTGDGNVTFLDGAVRAGGGSAPVRQIYFDVERSSLQPLPDGRVRAAVYSCEGEQAMFVFEKLPAMGNEVEDPDYDQTGIGAVQLKPAPFRVWLPVR
ncbi:MAG: glycoside hydrolase family 127 protein [Caldilineaceae bacterium]|nr:glycoside hydrolase family 127 protein [Caldilineaceae bacterium]